MGDCWRPDQRDELEPLKHALNVMTSQKINAVMYIHASVAKRYSHGKRKEPEEGTPLERCALKRRDQIRDVWPTKINVWTFILTVRHGSVKVMI